MLSTTGLSPAVALCSNQLHLASAYACCAKALARGGLATPWAQRVLAWHAHGLGSARFVRHYSGPVRFLGVLRCFSSPGAPLQCR